MDETYGTRPFEQIYAIVKEINSKSKGEVYLEEYQKALKNYMSAEQIKSDLYLLLAILQIESGTN